MTISLHPRIRNLLHEYQDGLSAVEISEKLSKDDRSVRRALKTMPDTYIDRWLKAKQKLPAQAVWCAVVPPEDCPRPS
jgi:hypothetical protein